MGTEHAKISLNNQHVMTCWMDSLERPKQQKIDIRFSGSGSLKTVARELAQYISVVIQVRWVKNGTEPADNCTFSVEMRMRVIISVEFISEQSIMVY